MFNLTLNLLKLKFLWGTLYWLGKPYRDNYMGKGDHYAHRVLIILLGLAIIAFVVATTILTYGIIFLIFFGFTILIDVCLLLSRLYYIQAEVRKAKGSNLPVSTDFWKDDD